MLVFNIFFLFPTLAIAGDYFNFPVQGGDGWAINNEGAVNYDHSLWDLETTDQKNGKSKTQYTYRDPKKMGIKSVIQIDQAEKNITTMSQMIDIKAMDDRHFTVAQFEPDGTISAITQCNDKMSECATANKDVCALIAKNDWKAVGAQGAPTAKNFKEINARMQYCFTMLEKRPVGGELSKQENIAGAKMIELQGLGPSVSQLLNRQVDVHGTSKFLSKDNDSLLQLSMLIRLCEVQYGAQSAIKEIDLGHGGSTIQFRRPSPSTK